ncbi:hypothetical protein PANO111632_14185 [Paracoccus nototheniae]|uniref:MarR family transcriptional regulator n=1 Tax=Paracoccus nototheniae TaxID=2489002 RepID=A0ABW4E0N7_9RHOB|nr:hypothetical protein [Paracoccus nototheniae]
MPTMGLSARLSIKRTALYRALAVLKRRDLVRSEVGRWREQILCLTDAGTALHRRAKKGWAVTQDAFVAAVGADGPVFVTMLDRARAMSDTLSNADPSGTDQPETGGITR